MTQSEFVSAALFQTLDRSQFMVYVNRGLISLCEAIREYNYLRMYNEPAW